MKKYLFLFVTAVSLALFPGRAHAQRYLPGMKGVELRGGFANGSKSPLNHYAGFAVSGYTKRADRWVIGAEYLMKNYKESLKNQTIAVLVVSVVLSVFIRFFDIACQYVVEFIR